MEQETDCQNMSNHKSRECQCCPWIQIIDLSNGDIMAVDVHFGDGRVPLGSELGLEIFFKQITLLTLDRILVNLTVDIRVVG